LHDRGHRSRVDHDLPIMRCALREKRNRGVLAARGQTLATWIAVPANESIMRPNAL